MKLPGCVRSSWDGPRSRSLNAGMVRTIRVAVAASCGDCSAVTTGGASGGPLSTLTVNGDTVTVARFACSKMRPFTGPSRKRTVALVSSRTRRVVTGPAPTWLRRLTKKAMCTMTSSLGFGCSSTVGADMAATPASETVEPPTGTVVGSGK